MQEINRKKRSAFRIKGRNVFYSVVFIFTAALAAVVLYWKINKNHIIRKKLEEAIHEKSKGLYKIQYDKLELDENTGSLSVTNMKVVYDSSRYSVLQRNQATPSILLEVYIPQLNIYGVKTSRALLSKELVGDKLEIKYPTIKIIYTMEGKDSTRNVPDNEIYEEILGELKQISIDTLNISGAKLLTKRMRENKQLLEFTDLFVQMSDVKIDSTANMDKSRLLFSKKIKLTCDNFWWISPGGLYKFEVNKISLNSDQNAATVSGFCIRPRLSETAFEKNLSTQDDRFDFSFRNISIAALDFHKLLDEKIFAERIRVSNASLKIYRDLNVPHDNKNRVGNYPQQVFDRIHIPVAVKKLNIQNAFIEYKEKSNITHQPGKVQFYNTTAEIKNMVNRRARDRNNDVMTVKTNSDFLNRASLSTFWIFYMNSSNGRFDVKGKLGSIDGGSLNRLTEPMGPATIKSGKVTSMDFDLHGNNYSMNGNIKLLYDDFKISLLEKDDRAQKMDKKHFSSFIANLMIKDSNPSGKSDPREVQVKNTRDIHRSIFNLAWKTLFKGVNETIGIKNKAALSVN